MDLSKPASDVGTSKDNSEIAGPVAHIDKTAAPPMPLAEANVESSRVVRRGKLVRSTSSLCDNGPSYSFVSTQSLEVIEKDMEKQKRGDKFVRRLRRGSSFIINQGSKLKIKRGLSFGCDAKTQIRQIEKFIDRGIEIKNNFLTKKIADGAVVEEEGNLELEKMELKVGQSILKTEKSNINLVEKENGIKNVQFEDENNFDSKLPQLIPGTGSYKYKKSESQIKLQLSHSFAQRSEIPHLRMLNLKNASNYICEDRWFEKAPPGGKNLTTISKVGNTADNNNFRICSSNIQKSLDDFVVSKKSLDEVEHPPPLSNLHIFAMSKRPVDIEVVDNFQSVPFEIHRLPDFPILGLEKAPLGEKLSILEPPPPGLVSRKESNENWNQFLVQLNAILESREEEFV